MSETVNPNLPSTAQMVSIYKKLFVMLSVITIATIVAVFFFHIPVWMALTGGLILIAIKSTIVYEAFKQFMVGRNIIVLIFGLTAIFVLGLLLLPIMNRNSEIAGTQDISKDLQMEQAAAQPAKEEGHHGN